MKIRKCPALLSFLLLALSFNLPAQFKMPVSFSYTTKKLSDSEYLLIFSAKMEPTWHLYSQVPHKGDEGPLPTVFNYIKSPHYQLVGKTVEPKPIAKPEPAFEGSPIIEFFEDKATFTQKIKALKDGDFSVKGTIEGMTCNEGQCIPFQPPFDFEFKITGAKISADVKAPDSVTKDVAPQFKMPVSWSYETKKLSDSEYELVFTAKIDSTWHLYSQEPPKGDGPLPTAFNFTSSPSYELVGKTSEPEGISKPEPAFDGSPVVTYFEGTAVFRQKVKALKDGDLTIKGTIEGMVCRESQCVPLQPPPDFEFRITGAKAGTSEIITSDSGTSDNSWLGIFLAGFLGGFAALLTPCVFPMIPMTVSFFTKRSKTKAKGVSNAMIYAASIIIIYVSLGLGVTAAFGSDALNALSTNVWFNLFFFILLVVFAISFFGAFEITLPSSFVNKVDSASDRGGLIGIFFMAFTLSLVSFSCTGPIIGTLLVEAATKGGSGPFWGMLGFSMALALPFGFFAAFPGYLNSLPKSGGWLNSVKVVLGFIELAFAFKFLSNADLVVQTGLLTREIFLAIWIVIGALMGIYLMGWFRLPHDSEMKHLSVFRLCIAILTFAFTIYMIPGMWGAPVKLLSGITPPSTYSESPHGLGGGGGSHTDESKLPEHAHLGPHSIPAFDDYDHALAYAKTVNKPLLLDFTGWACANCRRMEDNVWSDPEVKKRLINDVVLVSLYVDDKRELPKEQQVEVDWNGKRTLITIGNKWSYLQQSKFKALAQPQYWIVDHNGEPLIGSSDYAKGNVPANYAKWIDSGVEAFKNKK